MLMKSNEILRLIEEIIDVRYKYNHERQLENISYSSKILKEEYEPLAKKLSLLLKQTLDEKAD